MHHSCSRMLRVRGVCVGFVLGAAVVAAVVWAVLWFKDQQTDQTLDLAFSTIHAEAKAKLPPEDLETLTQQLREILEITHAQAARGLPAKQARRMAMRAAIQTIASAIEIDRMFSPTGRQAT